MLLRDLKQNMFLPKKEIFINKIVNIRGVDVQLISITSEESRNVLWAIYASPCCFDDEIDSEEREEYASNREEMINNITSERRYSHIDICEIIIQKQKITFSSSSASPIDHMDYEKYMQMQHFIENGMDTTNWNEVDLDNIVIAAYEQRENEEFPEIDLSKELDITLKIRENFREVLINHPMCLKFNKIETDNKFYFYDSIEKKNRIFYIDKMEHYDIWEEVNNTFQHEKMQHFTKQQINEMKEEYMVCLENTCPKGMNLAIIEYETEDNVQLNFYLKEYLDERPVHNTSSSSVMLFKSDRVLGDNGFKSRVCMIKPVEKDFNGSIDVELFSWYMEIQEEIIRI